MFIAISPSLLSATRTAMLFWTLASNGNTYFIEVPSCAPHEAKHESCMSVFQTKSLPAPYAGKTWRYQEQYVTLVLDANPLVIIHEIGHAVIAMQYHSAPNTSIMSPYIGPKCLSDEDAEAYERKYSKPLKLLCL